MTLRDHQVIFTKNIGLLIGYIFSKGYEITLSEAYRTPLQAWVNALPEGSTITATLPGASAMKSEWTEKVGGTGSAKSLHKLRLAIDLNLFKDGAYLTDETHHKQFGDYWKSLNALNRTGIDWNDSGHYSMEYLGMR